MPHSSRSAVHTGRSRPPILSLITLAMLAFSLAAFAAVSQAQPIPPGSDLFRTPGTGSTYTDFSGTPIPAGFFGPGSDPFIGKVIYVGTPLTTVPPGALGPTDTIVHRTGVAVPPCGGQVTIPIEIVALNLVSVNPITVTYGGGPIEQWNVSASLSSIAPQPPGTMTIKKLATQGGTFSSSLPVQPRITFTRVGPPATRIIDPAPLLQFSTVNGYWLNFDPGFFLITAAPGITVDGDNNPITPNVPVLPTSGNFYAGMRGLPLSCIGSISGAGKTLTQEQALLASHGVLPPQQHQPPGGEGAACLSDCSCIITTPAFATALGAKFQGLGTECLGDLDHNNQDDVCGNMIPGVSSWGLALLVALLLASGLWYAARRRGSMTSAG